MYAQIADPVPFPTVGQLHYTRSKGYVTWCLKGKWDKEKLYTIDERISIGKVVPGKEGYLYPNKNYFKFFDINGNLKEEIEEKTNDAFQTMKKKTENINEESRDYGLQTIGQFAHEISYGVHLALFRCAQDIGCIDALKKSFPFLWRKIFALSNFFIDDQNSVAQDFEGWGFFNFSGLNRVLKSSEITPIYKEISEEEEGIKNFLYYFRENYFQKFSSPSHRAIAFDSTNQNANSKNIHLAEYGHAKVDENLPDIQTAMFVDEETGIPIYYEHFFGSLNDKTQTPYTLEHVQDLGFKKIFAIMDRGYFSKKCLKSFNNIEFAVMCPESYSFTIQIIEKYSQMIKDCSQFYIKEENVYGIHIENVEFDKNLYDAYLFYDSKRAEDERASIYKKLEFFEEKIERRKRYSEQLKKKYSPWISITKTETKNKNSQNFSFERNHEAIQNCLNKVGFFVILSNAGLSASDMIVIARKRDVNEKAFCRLKNFLNLTKTYSHSTETYEGKMFVGFISLIILGAYRYLIKDVLKAKSSETTATTLYELKKYQIYRKHDGNWAPIYALTAKMKKIFSSIGLDADTVESMARKVFRETD